MYIYIRSLSFAWAQNRIQPVFQRRVNLGLKMPCSY